MTSTRGIRFQPPLLERTPELDRTLRSAFSTLRADRGGDVDPSAMVTLSRRLRVGCRIGARVGELGLDATPGGAALAREAQDAAASALRAMMAARRVAEIAALLGIEGCFLKGTALAAYEASAPGTRPLADVDVLVEWRQAGSFAAALAEDGFASVGDRLPHQLPSLVHARLGSVEIHVHLPGIVVGSRTRFATYSDLEAAGLLAAWPGMPAGAKLPSRPLLAAHLLAHALGQHGFRPDGYPLTRLLGDLIDLGAGREGGPELLEAALRLLSPLVPRVEAQAAFAAAAALATGDTALVESDSAAGKLLRHLLAAELDLAYRERLKLQDLAHPLLEGGPLRRRLAAARHALLLSRSRIDSIYGPPRRRWGYAARRLLRPLDLAWRAGRSLL